MKKYFTYLYPTFFLFLAFFLLSCDSGGKGKSGTDVSNKSLTPHKLPFPEETAHELFNQGRYKLAAMKFEEKLKTSPKDIKLRLLAGKAAYLGKEYASVKRILTPLIENKVGGQNEALAWQYLAQSLMESGKNEKGKEIFLQIRSRYKDEHENLRAMVMHEGNILWKNGLWDEALAVFKELIKIGDSKQKPGVELQMALVLRDAGKAKESQKLLEKLVTNNSSQKNVANEARLHLARHQISIKKYDKAISIANKAEKNGADLNQVAQILLTIARKQMENKETDKAQKFYAEMLTRFKDNNKILNSVRAGMANFYLSIDEKGKALGLFKLIAKESADDKQKQWAQDSIEELSKR